MRTCSRRTSFSMAVQSMDFQSVGRSKDASVDCSTVICFSFFTMVLPVLLQRGTRPTWAYPAHYTPALAFSVLPRLRPLTRLAVRSARSRLRAGLEVFPRSEEHTSELQSLTNLVCRLLLEKKNNEPHSVYSL